MGNCFAACSQGRRSVAKLTPENRVTSTSRSLNTLLKRGETPPKNLQSEERSSVRIPKIWSRRKNRVSPCNSDSVENARNTETLQESANRLSPASQSSDSSECSVSSEDTSSINSSSEELSSDSCQPVSDNEKSRTPSPIIQPGVTKGRLIIVQPCKTMSSSFDEVTSTAELAHVEISSQTPTTTEAEAEIEKVDVSKGGSLEIYSSTSSLGSWTDDPQNIELEQMSEDESCQVFPYIAGMHM